jgi:hypothetical protein
MDSYRPIRRQEPGMEDTVISIKKTVFESAPPLSFLNAEYEVITAMSAYYDPLNEQVSSSVQVNYVINRSYNYLASNPVMYRHKGDRVDMEIYVDSYNFIQKQPIVDYFSFEPVLDSMTNEDFYLRTTTAYIYKDIEVPRASNRIWDGRYLRCVDIEGNDIDNRSRLTECREDVKNRLDSVNNIYLVQNIGSKSRTVIPPRSDLYAVNYQFEQEGFIVTNYNSLGIPERPRRRANEDIQLEVKAREGLGTGRFLFEEGFVAAVLDGYYFVKWANVYRYKEEEIEVQEDNGYGYLIDGYNSDNEALVVLSRIPEPEPEEIVIEDKIVEYIVIPYIDSNVYLYEIQLEPPASATSLIVSLLIEDESIRTYINDIAVDRSYTFSVIPDSLLIEFKSNLIEEQVIVCHLTYQ